MLILAVNKHPPACNSLFLAHARMLNKEEVESHVRDLSPIVSTDSLGLGLTLCECGIINSMAKVVLVPTWILVIWINFFGVGDGSADIACQ